MPSEAQSHANPSSQRRPRRPPLVGVAVLLVVGGAIALPMLMDSGCSTTKDGLAASTEPMELSGRWLGMMLASADSATARSLGIPGVVAGVVIAEVARDVTSRVAQVGLAPGDVIVKVDGTATGSLAELYTLTTRLNIARPLPLEIMRQGQQMMVVLPPPMEVGTQPPMALQPTAQPTAWATPQGATPLPALQPVMPQPAAQAPAQQANLGWPAAAATPGTGVPGAMGR